MAALNTPKIANQCMDTLFRSTLGGALWDGYMGGGWVKGNGGGKGILMHHYGFAHKLALYFSLCFLWRGRSCLVFHSITYIYTSLWASLAVFACPLGSCLYTLSGFV